MAIRDVLKFYKGNRPVIEFETDPQKGGHFPSSSCEIGADRFLDFAHSVYFKHLTLEHMQYIIFSCGILKENTLKKQITHWQSIKEGITGGIILT